MKIRLLRIITFTLFLLLAAGLFYLQIIKGPIYRRMSRDNRIRLVSIESPRGRIFDREGRLLVDNRISFDVAIIPQELENKDSIMERLSVRLGIPVEELEEALKDNFIAPFQPVRVASDIGKEAAISLEEERLDLPGMFIETRPRRYYPYKKVASHILGYLGQINSAELAKLKTYGYRMDDLIGRAGIEKYYDNYLRGEHGGKQLEVDNMGYQVGILGFREPVRGKDIYLTIDIRLQEYIEKIFEGARGGVCVMDPKSGEVLSLVSLPSFDPNFFVDEKSFRKIKQLFRRKDYPMLDRMIQCAYPPGSVFKVVTAAAALAKKKFLPETALSCGGSYSLGKKAFRCWKKSGHGAQAIREAIKNSCNVFFYQAGRIAGVDGMAKYAAKFGFGRPSGIDLPNEASGLLPNRMWKTLKKREPWYEGETLNYAIGQGYLLVTPIQILRMISAVANEGYLVRPYLAKRIEDVDISKQKEAPINISKESLDIIREGLVRVVNDRGGTGRMAAVKSIVIAGKTGTAQTSTERTHAWFTGFAPADDPKASLVVFLEYGGKGGLRASKTAGSIFAKLKKLGYL